MRQTRSVSLLRARALSLKATSILLTLCSLAQAGALPASTPAQADPKRYITDIQQLTIPSMEGRGDGTKGLDRAASMLEKRYKSFGLKPAGTHGYRQPFTVIMGARLKPDTKLSVLEGNARQELVLNRDFVPFSFSASGHADGPVVFVGYGATAPEFGYDDYAGIDVKDKVVLVLRYEPASFAERGGHQGITQHSQVISKAINAKNHGARAMILVNGKLGDGEEDLLTRFGSVSGPENSGIVILQVKNAIADEWLHATKGSLANAQAEIEHGGKPASVTLPETLRAAAQVDVETTRAVVNNVLAYLPGKTDEYIILGAHYDHLGYGNYDSLAPSQIGQIHPGADDNGSGTAGLLELARVLVPMKGQLQRGILFASFAGEELGLLGSAEWVKEPTLPLGKAVAMLNMDMIGRIHDGKVYVGGVGTGSTFPALLEKASADSGFKMEYSQGGYSASDHTSYVAKQIPVLFFFSGLHSDYHKPSDTWEKIDPNAAVRLLDVISKATVELASADDRPQFKVVVEDKPPAGGGGGGYGPYFGSIPDFGQVETGVRFSDVKPNSPAAKAGLKGGDILVQFGDKPIKNLYDFTDALRRSKIGDVVQITVLRDGKSMTVPVKLEQRK